MNTLAPQHNLQHNFQHNFKHKLIEKGMKYLYRIRACGRRAVVECGNAVASKLQRRFKSYKNNNNNNSKDNLSKITFLPQ